MNSSDIINALGVTPGFLAALGNASTFNYTALTNIQVTLNCAIVSGGNVTVNGASVGTSASGPVQVNYNLAKGQTTTIVTTNANALVTARSIA